MIMNEAVMNKAFTRLPSKPLLEALSLKLHTSKVNVVC